MSFSLLSLPIPFIVLLNPELYKCADFCSYVIIFILGNVQKTIEVHCGQMSKNTQTKTEILLSEIRNCSGELSS